MSALTYIQSLIICTGAEISVVQYYWEIQLTYKQSMLPAITFLGKSSELENKQD